MHDAVNQGRPVGLDVGGPAASQLIERYAEPIDVHAGIALSVQPLRGQVAQSPQQVAGLGQCHGVAVVVSQTEIGYPDRALIVHEEIGGLHVAVDHTL